MPSILNANLTLTQVGTDVRIDITYDLRFTRLETNLSALGMVFTEQVEVIGVDPEGSTTGKHLAFVAVGRIELPPINDAQTLHRAFTRTVPRATLDEDPDMIAQNADEIRGRIRVLGHGPSRAPDAFTNQVILGGGVVIGP